MADVGLPRGGPSAFCAARCSPASLDSPISAHGPPSWTSRVLLGGDLGAACGRDSVPGPRFPGVSLLPPPPASLCRHLPATQHCRLGRERWARLERERGWLAARTPPVPAPGRAPARHTCTHYSHHAPTPTASKDELMRWVVLGSPERGPPYYTPLLPSPVLLPPLPEADWPPGRSQGTWASSCRWTWGCRRSCRVVRAPSLCAERGLSAPGSPPGSWKLGPRHPRPHVFPH